VTLCEDDIQNRLPNAAEENPSLFAIVLRDICAFLTRGVVESANSKRERHIVLAQVGFGFQGVPLEVHEWMILQMWLLL